MHKKKEVDVTNVWFLIDIDENEGTFPRVTVLGYRYFPKIQRGGQTDVYGHNPKLN